MSTSSTTATTATTATTTPATATTPQQSFTPAQLETLFAIADALIPALTPQQIEQLKSSLPPSVASDNTRCAALHHFASTSASQSPEFRKNLGIFERNFSRAKFHELTGLLDALRTRAGSLLLCGTWTPFHELSLEERQRIIHSWRNSNVATYKRVYRGIVPALTFIYMQTQEAWDGAGIPRVDPEIHSPERYGKKNFHQFEFEDFSGKDEVDYDVVIVGSGAGAGVAAKNISEWAKERGTNLRILVVEKGEYIPHEQLTLTEKEAFARMYEKGMMGPTEEGMNIMAGATFGGGTMINWAAALRTPGMVRREWAEEYGLGMYLSREFIDALERVEKRMGVSAEHCVHSGPNRALKEGAKRLGYAVHDVPQNTGGAPHACGYCANGCRYGEKQGAPNSWLVDASKAGAKFAQRVEVEKVIFEAENTGSGGWFGALETGSRRAKKKVAGLECWVGDRHAGPRRRLRINTRKVIISAGSLHSPVILLRSGLKNPEIGANFRCHPATYMYAFFPHDIPMNAITGPIISTVITETASLSPPPHTHYGSRVEIASPQAALSYGFFPWLDPIFWRTSIARYSHLAVAFSMARDGRRAPTAVRNSSGVVLPGSSELGPELFCGRIKLDPETGGPSVSYVLRKEDRESIVQGLLVGAESFLAAGAKEIVMPLFQGKPFVVPDGHSGITEGLNVPGFREWLVEIRRLGAVANSFPIGTGHQMGTCRMSAKSWEDGDECGDVAGASTAEWIGYLANAAGRVLVGGGSGKAKGVGRVKPGVVDVEGRVFGVEGLWVMDASVFPGATAVNPMLSVMSVSDVLSRKLVGRWEKEGTWDTAAAAARTAPA